MRIRSNPINPNSFLQVQNELLNFQAFTAALFLIYLSFFVYYHESTNIIVALCLQSWLKMHHVPSLKNAQQLLPELQ